MLLSTEQKIWMLKGIFENHRVQSCCVFSKIHLLTRSLKFMLELKFKVDSISVNRKVGSEGFGSTKVECKS